MRANHTTQPNRLEALTQTPAMAGGAGPSTSVLGASMRHRAGERERGNSKDHTRRVANHCGFRVTPLHTVWLRMATLADETVWHLEAHYAGAHVRILWAPPPDVRPARPSTKTRQTRHGNPPVLRVRVPSDQHTVGNDAIDASGVTKRGPRGRPSHGHQRGVVRTRMASSRIGSRSPEPSAARRQIGVSGRSSSRRSQRPRKPSACAFPTRRSATGWRASAGRAGSSLLRVSRR